MSNVYMLERRSKSGTEKGLTQSKLNDNRPKYTCLKHSLSPLFHLRTKKDHACTRHVLHEQKYGMCGPQCGINIVKSKVSRMKGAVGANALDTGLGQYLIAFFAWPAL